MNFYGKNKQKKKKAIVTLSALAVIMMIAGTFAWSSYTEWKKNHMQSRGFNTGEVTISEKFPDTEITPGAVLEKEVNVVNSSDSNVFVRVSFEEMLHKLKDGAVAKGYNTLADAKFPVIIDHSEYTGAGWIDETAMLLIDGTAPTAAAPGVDGYKLYTNGDKVALVYVKEMKVADFPEHFDFNDVATKIPVYSGTFAADDVMVAQKVSGSVNKNASNQYEYKTAPTGDLQYFGYGEDLDAKAEKNWGGDAIKVPTAIIATPPAIADFNKSLADTNIEFKMDNVETNIANIGTTAKTWFYNVADGYFYYLGKLLPSTTTTSSVLQSVKFPGTIGTDDTYGMASYDLWVGMEAIPSYKAAMEAAVDVAQSGKGAGGWGMTTTNPVYAHFLSIADAE